MEALELQPCDIELENPLPFLIERGLDVDLLGFLCSAKEAIEAIEEKVSRASIGGPHPSVCPGFSAVESDGDVAAIYSREKLPAFHHEDYVAAIFRMATQD